MLKKYSSFIFLGIMVTLSYNLESAIDTKLQHILIQLNAVKRAWNEARVKIKMSQKASSAMYYRVSPVFGNIIASADFVNKMNQKVDEQVDAITNQYLSFSSVKANVPLSDFFTGTMHDFGKSLFAAMAQKAYTYLLGQKLVDKVKQMRQQEQAINY